MMLSMPQKTHRCLHWAAVLLLFFLSGATALVYEVLWMKELGLLFGNTSYAAATTLAAFFLGMATGGWFWGQRAGRLKNPLSTYGLLELAVAVSVAGYFLMLDGYHQLYPALFERFGTDRWAFVAVKFGLAMLVLAPPAFFVGGTLPVISQYLVRERSSVGRNVALIYAVNTFGAALGALLAGFCLPLWLGFDQTYRMAMALSAAIGVTAILLARKQSVPPLMLAPARERSSDDTSVESALPLPLLRGLALLSGLVTLALQVLWTRMFAQVLQNSVYTFAVILVMFLLCLAFGATLANRLMRIRSQPVTTLFSLLTAGALLVSFSPFVFDLWTDGLHYIGGQSGWSSYILNVFATALVVMGPPLLVLGTIFPYLLKLAEPNVDSVGRMVGQLSALNTVGAIVGSLTAGFLILDWLGLWSGIRLMGILYLLAALYVTVCVRSNSPKRLAIPMVGIVLLVSLLDTTRLPLVRVDPVNEEEALLEVWEGSAATVAVVRRRDALKIKVNNYYTLGGSGSRELEALQGYLPVILHPRPRTVYMLGLGTGITAGAALHLPIERLVVTELIPEVLAASDKYFGPYNNNLFYDRRTEVIPEDGRNYLAGAREQFDVIVADLFVPWKAGTGSLYTVEHYRTVYDHLGNDGLFMQWLPAYQISQAEFAMIARSMLAVFPQVTLWRGDFSTRKPIIGLLGQTRRSPLSPDVLMFSMEAASEKEQRVPMLAHYIGNLDRLRDRFDAYPLNRDDRPVIEYWAPITQRQQKTNQSAWLTGERLIDLMAEIQAAVPPADDPFLQLLPARLQRLPEAGMLLHRSQVLKRQGRLTAAQEAYARYEAVLDAEADSRGRDKE
jgi:spermidine synthase